MESLIALLLVIKVLILYSLVLFEFFNLCRLIYLRGVEARRRKGRKTRTENRGKFSRKNYVVC